MINNIAFQKDHTKDISADDRSIEQVLDKQKYLIDYFQREYRWEQKHIVQLVGDLTSAFLNDYRPEHERMLVENYNCYYLGPFVVSDRGGKRSIIDGQQRLTSITLLLMYLNNLQKEEGFSESLESMIYSEKYGKKSFNLNIPERVDVFDQLFQHGTYNLTEKDDESSINMVERYQDIVQQFPEDIKGAALPYFIDWLKNRVTLVEIIAYSDDNAYTIFETMNDRGMNLTSTEMLKGFLLSRLADDTQRKKANEIWQQAIKDLHQFDKNTDQHFFQSFLRAKYAHTIRQGKAGSQNEDFENIGTRFHAWVKSSLSEMDLERSEDFRKFIENEFIFYKNVFKKIHTSSAQLTEGFEPLYYIRRWGIADSIKDPLLLAPITMEDDEATINKKLLAVANFLEIFAFRRTINFRRYSQTAIRYTMYTLVKEIRNKPLLELKKVLHAKVENLAGNLDAFHAFHLHGQNKHFVKLILSRITAWLDMKMGRPQTFLSYFEKGHGKPMEVEHIWANHFEEHKDEFDNQYEFAKTRNQLGDLILIPRGTNQSYGDLPYTEKLPHYLKENILAQSLHSECYQRNPNFLAVIKKYNFNFKSHQQYKKADIFERQELYKAICEEIWSLRLLEE